MSEHWHNESHWYGCGTSTNYSYWASFPSLSITEAAYIYDGNDPRAATDLVEPDGCPIDLTDEIKLIASACHSKQIRFYPRTQGDAISKETMIDRVSFARWLLRDTLKKHIGEKLLSTAPALGDADSPSEQLAAHHRAVAPPPGKLPRTSASRLAVFAAWEIECFWRRPATTDETFGRLIEWSEGMEHTDILRPYDRKRREIPWVTSNYVLKHYGKEACKRALSRWRKSRCESLKDKSGDTRDALEPQGNTDQ